MYDCIRYIFLKMLINSLIENDYICVILIFDKSSQAFGIWGFNSNINIVSQGFTTLYHIKYSNIYNAQITF